MAEAPHVWTDSAKRGTGNAMSAADLFSLVGDDEEIQRKVKLFINMTLDNAFKVLLHGTVAERTQMTRAMLPAIVKMMAQKDDGGLSALREQMMTMMAGMNAAPTPSHAVNPTPRRRV